MGGSCGPKKYLRLRVLVCFKEVRNISKLLGTPKVTVAIKFRKTLVRKQFCEWYNGQSAAKLLRHMHGKEKVQRLYGSGRDQSCLKDSLSRESKGKTFGMNCGIRFVDCHHISCWFYFYFNYLWRLIDGVNNSQSLLSSRCTALERDQI
jgi:hypothetical protein